MERYFRSIPGARGRASGLKGYWSLNGGHSALSFEKRPLKEDRPKAEKMSKILLYQANLIAGLPIEDPSEFTELVCGLF
jgi:molecular chaperone HtpG